MKKFSVKIRISVWLTLLTGLLAGLLLVFMLSISRVVADQTAISQLIRIVRSNLAQTAISNGRLIWEVILFFIKTECLLWFTVRMKRY